MMADAFPFPKPLGWYYHKKLWNIWKLRSFNHKTCAFGTLGRQHAPWHDANVCRISRQTAKPTQPYKPILAISESKEAVL
jgi:hypothetical protein